MPDASIIRVLPQDCAFGKLERSHDGAIAAWHPLIDHLADVAACFQRLCFCRSIRRAMEKASGRALGSQDFARLTVLVFLHDLGKANSGFQAKRWLKGAIPKGWPSHAGHGREAIKLFDEDRFLQALVALLPVDAICTWGEAVDPLLKASISHHGRPVIDNPENWNRAIWKPVIGADGQALYDPAPVLEQIGRRATGDRTLPGSLRAGWRSVAGRAGLRSSVRGIGPTGGLARLGHCVFPVFDAW
jgi:CRISPR-associated endonuclease/helicase Cas3